MQQNKTILVTGSAGMIGSHVVRGLVEQGYSVVGIDMRTGEWRHERFLQHVADLADGEALRKVMQETKPERVIHLAALAHTKGEADVSWERFRHVNVTCAENLFRAAEEVHCPVLFISTVDAIGMVRGPISGEVRLNPVSNYGKSKALAEARMRELCSRWNIYRFSPVYTQDIKRDIEKRYYLRYPNWAYRIGKGERFEVLDVRRAVQAMVDWASKEVDNSIHIIRDPELMDVNELIAEERREGRARHVLWLPRWAVVCGYWAVRLVFGKSNKTYLVFKALWPFRTKE